MKGLLKFVGILLGVVVLIALGVGVFLYTQMDSLVADVIEEQGSKATGTRVAVGGVNIELGEARGSIRGLTVANPSGYDQPNALSMDELSLRINTSNLGRDLVVIDQVDVGGVRIALEQTTAGGNLQTLLDNIKRYAGAGGTTAESTTKIIINKLNMGETTVDVSLPQAGEQRQVTIPAFTVDGIGRASGGATAAQVARQVLEPLIQRALRSAAAQEIRGRAEEKLDEVKDDLKGRLLDRLGGDG